jgi:hypothetical protein
MTASPPRGPLAVSVATARNEAMRLEAENPRWIVVFGVYTKEFVCFPRFTVPGGTIVAARRPRAVVTRMRRVEHSARDAMAALMPGEPR